MRRRAADVVFSLPAALLLHAGAALHDAEYGAAFKALQHEAGSDLDQRCCLVLALVLQRCRGAASAWAPYIAMLPQCYGALARMLHALQMQAPLVVGGAGVRVCRTVELRL